MVFFTYGLWSGDRMVRIGKGSCGRKSHGEVEAYLERRYGKTRYTHISYQWHSSEGAAFKFERRLTLRHKMRHGELPERNAYHGGGGGRAFVRCKGAYGDGKKCRNDALAGNYGFCGVHRRL